MLVALPADGSGSVVNRVRGQVADLDAAVFSVVEAPADAASAFALASQARADIVVWWRSVDGAFDLALAHVPTSRMLERSIDRSGGDSAAFEAIAIVVRGALQDVDAGEPIGEVVPEVSAPAEPETETEPTAPASTSPAATEPVATEPTPSTPDPLGVRVTLGWLAAFDGHTPGGAQSPTLFAGAGRDRWWVGLSAALSLPTELDDAYGTLSLLRLRAAASARWRAWTGPVVGAHLGADLGVLGWRWELESDDPTLEALGPGMVARFFAAPVVGITIALGDSPLEIALEAGVDLVAGAPRFTYERQGTRETRNGLWVAQPFVRLTLGFAP